MNNQGTTEVVDVNLLVDAQYLVDGIDSNSKKNLTSTQGLVHHSSA